MTSAGTRHEMVMVPAGEFTMGSTDAAIIRLLTAHPSWRREWFVGEQPAHPVYLSAYYIDKHEVTNAHYAAFLNEIGGNTDGDGHVLINLEGDEVRIEKVGERFKLTDPEFADHPVVYVSWHGAAAYCAWSAGRLPTEAEWEKAARGADKRPYPWGSEAADTTRLNFGAIVGQTTPINHYWKGVSPYGIYDIAGNAYEWCADWYDAMYYAGILYRNPTGPKTGEYRVTRGGAWNLSAWRARTAVRDKDQPSNMSYNYGFRCVRQP